MPKSTCTHAHARTRTLTRTHTHTMQVYDNEHRVRERMIAAMRKEFAAYDLSFSVGMLNTHTGTHRHTQTHADTHRNTQTHTDTETDTQTLSLSLARALSRSLSLALSRSLSLSLARSLSIRGPDIVWCLSTGVGQNLLSTGTSSQKCSI